jgi:hypothetical protein
MEGLTLCLSQVDFPVPLGPSRKWLSLGAVKSRLISSINPAGLELATILFT